ncbi:hypothetical protein AURDEDRAFT_166744 [Auricularia subglabra TFB-10046 SS5]|nr:hypothetical protein AURDEDRAFT_166744 [Auricularia subglabra TFB-10046 SS5]
MLDALKDYHRNGVRWAYHLPAGSVSLLLASVLCRLQKKLIQVDMISFQEFCACIRSPEIKDAPVHVADWVVPTLCEWGRCFNLRLGSRTFGQDLLGNDQLLSDLPFNAWVLPDRGASWSSWDSSQQLTMFQQRPPELEPHVPAVWTPPPRTCVQVFTASDDHEKAFSPVAGRVRLPERMPSLERKAYIKETRKNFAAKERTCAQQRQTRPTSLDDLKAKGDDAAGAPVAQTADELEGNAHQRLPREHLDICKDVEGYTMSVLYCTKFSGSLASGYAPIKESLPCSYEVLLRYINELPLGNWSPCWPFAGLVLNFGAMTDPHIDEDLEICVVITFGKFTGGKLGLYEAKLLFELDRFSILIFPSEKFIHFNLPFQGEWGSIALATEKASLI